MASHGNFLANFFFIIVISEEERCLVQFHIFAKPERGVLIVVRNFKVDQTKTKKKTKTIAKNRIVKKVKSHPLFHLHAEIYIAHCRPLSHGEVT